jgi:hypothetical protein
MQLYWFLIIFTGENEFDKNAIVLLVPELLPGKNGVNEYDGTLVSDTFFINEFQKKIG